MLTVVVGRRDRADEDDETNAHRRKVWKLFKRTGRNITAMPFKQNIRQRPRRDDRRSTASAKVALDEALARPVRRRSTGLRKAARGQYAAAIAGCRKRTSDLDEIKQARNAAAGRRERYRLCSGWADRVLAGRRRWRSLPASPVRGRRGVPGPGRACTSWDNLDPGDLRGFAEQPAAGNDALYSRSPNPAVTGETLMQTAAGRFLRRPRRPGLAGAASASCSSA